VSTLHIINWTLELLQAVNSFLHLDKVVLVDDIIAGAKQSLHVGQPSLHLGKFVFPLDVIDRPGQRLHLLHLALKIFKQMMGIHTLSHRIMHFLQLLHLLSNLVEVMFPVHRVDWPLKAL